MATNVHAFRFISPAIDRSSSSLTCQIASPFASSRMKTTITLRNAALGRPILGRKQLGHSIPDYVTGHPALIARSTRTSAGWGTHRRDLILQSGIMLLGSSFEASSFGTESIFNIVATQYGKEFPLSQFAGKVVCIVNVASE
jgi:hypothetical protein